MCMYVSWVVYMLSSHADICVVLMCVFERAGTHVPVASHPGFWSVGPGLTLLSWSFVPSTHMHGLWHRLGW